MNEAHSREQLLDFLLCINSPKSGSHQLGIQSMDAHKSKKTESSAFKAPSFSQKFHCWFAAKAPLRRLPALDAPTAEPGRWQREHPAPGPTKPPVPRTAEMAGKMAKNLVFHG
jgi:hypothetical protein